IRNFRVVESNQSSKGAPKKWTAASSDGAVSIHRNTVQNIESSKIPERAEGGLPRVLSHEAGHGLWRTVSDTNKKSFSEALTNNQAVAEKVAKIVSVKAVPEAFSNTGSRELTETFAEVFAMKYYKPSTYNELPEAIRKPVESAIAAKKRFLDVHGAKGKPALPERTADTPKKKPKGKTHWPTQSELDSGDETKTENGVGYILKVGMKGKGEDAEAALKWYLPTGTAERNKVKRAAKMSESDGGMASAFPLGAGFGAKGKSPKARDRSIEKSVDDALATTAKAKQRERADIQRTKAEARAASDKAIREDTRSREEVIAGLEATAKRVGFDPKETKEFIKRALKKRDEAGGGRYSRHISQFQRHYYSLASEADEADWWASSTPGEIRALTPTGPVRYVKHASGGFSAEPIQ
ncbi:MAG TPA: hypothetical protein VMY37_31955, partial [Thermoguttaceae bacterium]|nr:hypothetical protein [Thermoguttaceae bacterium]